MATKLRPRQLGRLVVPQSQRLAVATASRLAALEVAEKAAAIAVPLQIALLGRRQLAGKVRPILLEELAGVRDHQG